MSAGQRSCEDAAGHGTMKERRGVIARLKTAASQRRHLASSGLLRGQQHFNSLHHAAMATLQDQLQRAFVMVRKEFAQ